MTESDTTPARSADEIRAALRETVRACDTRSAALTVADDDAARMADSLMDRIVGPLIAERDEQRRRADRNDWLISRWKAHYQNRIEKLTHRIETLRQRAERAEIELHDEVAEEMREHVAGAAETPCPECTADEGTCTCTQACGSILCRFWPPEPTNLVQHRLSPEHFRLDQDNRLHCPVPTCAWSSSQARGFSLLDVERWARLHLEQTRYDTAHIYWSGHTEMRVRLPTPLEHINITLGQPGIE